MKFTKTSVFRIITNYEREIAIHQILRHTVTHNIGCKDVSSEKHEQSALIDIATALRNTENPKKQKIRKFGNLKFQ